MPADQAEDVVQDFCCRLVEKRADLGVLDPAQGRFRAWLVTVFRHFISDWRAHHTAQMRGGGIRHQDVADSSATAEETDPTFDRDWAEVILANARARLAMESEPGTTDRYQLLGVYLERNADPGEYRLVGEQLGLGEGAVKVAVHRLRQRFAELVRQEIAETLADPSPQAINDELTALISSRVTEPPPVRG